ncbi:MAG: hypothetical protein D6763_06400 [Alphaproteobacteria bacterium]|nr:MAG: hypothetical protein D6763_06400 [Alphaproteobacteria bacterium]
MLRLVATSLIVILLSAGAALAGNCTRPPAPMVPDGTIATRDEMIAASQAVKAFMSETERYLDCLKVEESLTPPEQLTAETQQLLIDRHNAAIEDMERVATAYNQAVRDYKARIQDGGSN